jgi:hypothetical protein
VTLLPPEYRNRDPCSSMRSSRSERRRRPADACVRTASHRPPGLRHLRCYPPSSSYLPIRCLRRPRRPSCHRRLVRLHSPPHHRCPNFHRSTRSPRCRNFHRSMRSSRCRDVRRRRFLRSLHLRYRRRHQLRKLRRPKPLRCLKLRSRSHRLDHSSPLHRPRLRRYFSIQLRQRLHRG